ASVVPRPALPARPIDHLLAQQLHSDQGAALDPRLDVLISAELLMNGGENRASSGLIQNGCRPGWQVCLHTLLEVPGKLWVGQQISIPIAASWWPPGDVQMPRNIVEPYLYTTGLPSVPSPGGDIDEGVVFQCVLHLLVHIPSPIQMTGCC